MKKATLLLLILFPAFRGYPQCFPAIPPGVIVVTGQDTINGGFDPIWVCTGALLVSDGGFHNIFLESGAFMKTGGGIDTIYVSDDAKFSMNGGIHVIYYVSPGDLNLAGGIPTSIHCDTLEFDYTDAPKAGCVATLLPGTAAGSDLFSTYPNPASTEVFFEFGMQLPGNARLAVYDVSGKLKTETAVSSGIHSIPLEAYAAGLYFYRIFTLETMLTAGSFQVQE